MQNALRHIRKPVKREAAEQYLIITLLSFAASIILIRLFLELTGYPQVGNSELHIAHVLWGGLLLFIACLLTLVFTNRWVYKVSALLAGVGVGLFIDEVGKFITQSNNYFYPAAAPIIYTFFLLTVLVYLQVRRIRSNDVRAELYRALDQFEEVLDHNLNAQEHANLYAQLYRINQEATDPDTARLASVLREFLASNALYLAPDVPGRWKRWLRRVQGYATGWLTTRRLKLIIVGGLGFLGLVGLFFSIVFILALMNVVQALKPSDDLYLDLAIPSGSTAVSEPVPITYLDLGHLVGILAMLGLGGMVGLVLMTAAILLAIGREGRGSWLGYIGLLLSLTAVAPINFYFSQFGAVSDALAEFVLLLGVIRYRQRCLVPRFGRDLTEGYERSKPWTRGEDKPTDETERP